MAVSESRARLITLAFGSALSVAVLTGSPVARAEPASSTTAGHAPSAGLAKASSRAAAAATSTGGDTQRIDDHGAPTETYALTVPPHTVSFLVAEQPVYRDYGDFTVVEGNTIWILRDVYFDSPNPNGDSLYQSQEDLIPPAEDRGIDA